MAKTVRVPITNVFMDGDYTGEIHVGPANTKLNVILDTGSSALAVDGQKYEPSPGDKLTNVAQADSYGDGSSWTGAVINTTVTFQNAGNAIALAGANVAVAYQASKDMFSGADGILGLAYAPLDDAFSMPQQTWTTKYTSDQVQSGKRGVITPYLTQLAQAGITSDIVSFYTKRSFIRGGANPAADDLNKGWMIIGGGQEETSLYSGAFHAVKVLADDWYNTNLVAITVGNTPPIHVPKRGQHGMPSNSIVDSGTNSLNLGPTLLKAVLAKFSKSQQELLVRGMENGVANHDVGDLGQWPTLTFTLQGASGVVSLDVAPGDYWQLDTDKPGVAAVAITQGSDGLAILGLPLMNGYFTVFDGEADSGKGQILFATRA